MSRLLTLIALTALLVVRALPACAAHKLIVSGNRIVLDGIKGQILYRSSGDLDKDGNSETAFAMSPSDDRSNPIIIIARLSGHQWKVITSQQDGCYDLRTDISDVNRDGRVELVARGLSGDGHGWCDIFVLENGKLQGIGSFHATRFIDLDGDGVPEIRSDEMIIAGCLGDWWPKVFKWNGRSYINVTRNHPRMFVTVIEKLRRMASEISGDASTRSLVYYYLGQAYEYSGQPNKAKMPYAIAYRLDPTFEDFKTAFRRAWQIKTK